MPGRGAPPPAAGAATAASAECRFCFVWQQQGLVSIGNMQPFAGGSGMQHGRGAVRNQRAARRRQCGSWRDKEPLGCLCGGARQADK